jgi:hypothetical protein
MEEGRLATAWSLTKMIYDTPGIMVDLMRGQDLGVGAQDDRGESQKTFGAEKTAGQTEGMIEVPEGMGVMTRSDMDEKWRRKVIFLRIAMEEFRIVFACLGEHKVGRGPASVEFALSAHS